MRNILLAVASFGYALVLLFGAGMIIDSLIIFLQTSSLSLYQFLFDFGISDLNIIILRQNIFTASLMLAWFTGIYVWCARRCLRQTQEAIVPPR